MYSLTLVVELWIQLCSRLEMKDHLHQESYAKSCREIEELKRCCYQEGNYIKKQRRLGEFPTQHDQESRTVSLFFYDPDLLSSYDDLHSSSSPYYFVFKKAEPRSWNAAKYTREYEYSWKRFLIVTMLDEILMNYTIVQEICQHHWESLKMSRILRKEGIENSGSEEPLQSIPLPCSSERAMRKRLNDK